MTHYVHELRDDSTKKEEVETMFHRVIATAPTPAQTLIILTTNDDFVNLFWLYEIPAL